MAISLLNLCYPLSLSFTLYLTSLPFGVIGNKVTERNSNKKLSSYNGGEDVIALSAGGLTKDTRLYVTISISSPDPRADSGSVLSNSSTGKIGDGGRE